MATCERPFYAVFGVVFINQRVVYFCGMNSHRSPWVLGRFGVPTFSRGMKRQQSGCVGLCVHARNPNTRSTLGGGPTLESRKICGFEQAYLFALDTRARTCLVPLIDWPASKAQRCWKIEGEYAVIGIADVWNGNSFSSERSVRRRRNLVPCHPHL